MSKSIIAGPHKVIVEFIDADAAAGSRIVMPTGFKGQVISAKAIVYNSELELDIGDEVVFAYESAGKVKIDGTDYLVLHEDNVIAIVKENHRVAIPYSDKEIDANGVIA